MKLVILDRDGTINEDRDDYVKSPDEWDAVALTFAEPVAADAGFGRRIDYPASGVA